jgi:aspartyl protease family protein
VSPPGQKPRRWQWYLLAALAAVLLVHLLSQNHPGNLDAESDVPRLAYVVALLVLVGGGVFARIARRPSQAVQHAGIWLGIGLVVFLGYSYRDELTGVFHRLSGELDPSAGQAIDGQSMRFTAGADGQFHVDATIGSTPMRFLIDTGASEVMLSPGDARRLGYEPSTLAYTKMYQTANGIVRGAPVTIPVIVIGPIRVTDVEASVNEHDTDGSLLGMSFLRRLSGWQVSGNTLTLRQ